MNTSKIAALFFFIAGVGFIGFSVGGLYNSSLDTRVILLIALGAAGLIFLALGFQQLPRRRDR